MLIILISRHNVECRSTRIIWWELFDLESDLSMLYPMSQLATHLKLYEFFTTVYFLVFCTTAAICEKNQAISQLGQLYISGVTSPATAAAVVSVSFCSVGVRRHSAVENVASLWYNMSARSYDVTMVFMGKDAIHGIILTIYMYCIKLQLSRVVCIASQLYTP